ncbi:hypothetical protein [Vibrio sp. 779(2023)]|uniref:hypothetical protein n=1 Tax=Vibrio sp. 779(2023) TaxID=3074712 RepID=UPI002966F140|nr:hypothetical protein [Vibrio sp. 779(2023)]MDW3153974.1 hypothetical protein [Vibrio sp. 779(2023)]
MAVVNEFIEVIAHKASEGQQEAEASEKLGVKLDGKDGISVAVGFRENELSKADYISIDNDVIKILELSDLRDKLKECFDKLQELKMQYMVEHNCNFVPNSKVRKLNKVAYEPIKSELAQKWSGSIATCERLIRLESIETNNPKYKYTLVCPNGTDLRAADHVKTMMQGMCGEFNIINTEHL